MNPPRIFIIAGEASGDVLGAGLIRALRERQPDCTIEGVGGPAMTGQGLKSLFPIADIAVMGIVPVLARLPSLLRRIRETKAAIIAQRPDVLLIIDSPDFTHRVAKGVRALSPDIRIVNYVSPTVWAWRPGRAKTMSAYVDHLMALLPFEPAAHLRLGGPPTTYVGHPLAASMGEPPPPKPLDSTSPLILVLPGSRYSEVRLLMQPFGEAVQRVAEAMPGARFALPAVPHLRADIEAALETWPIKPKLIDTEAEKIAAFRAADAAIAASGTVTLELALANVPMVVGYKSSAIEMFIFDHFVAVTTVILPNLILGEEFVPQFLQAECSGEKLTKALTPLLRNGSERDAQLSAFSRVRAAIRVEGDDPSARAAQIVIGMVR